MPSPFFAEIEMRVENAGWSIFNKLMLIFTLSHLTQYYRPIRLNTKKTNAVTIPIIISINIGCSVSLKLFQLQAQLACQSNIGSTIHYIELCIAYILWLNCKNGYVCVHTCSPYSGVLSAKWNGIKPFNLATLLKRKNSTLI